MQYRASCKLLVDRQASHQKADELCVENLILTNNTQLVYLLSHSS